MLTTLKEKLRKVYLTIRVKLYKQDDSTPITECYLRNPQSTHLDQEQLFGLCLWLVIAEPHWAYWDSLDTGNTYYDEKIILWKWWEIHDTKSAKETIEWLLAGGHADLFNRLLEMNREQGWVYTEDLDFSDSDFDDDVDEEELRVYFENLFEVFELENAGYFFDDLGERYEIWADAWDLGRAIFLSRVCYSLGYLRSDEAWWYIEQIQIIAREQFTNWRDYVTSYLVGRAMWWGDNGTWENVSSHAIHALDRSESPLRKISWKNWELE